MRQVTVFTLLFLVSIGNSFAICKLNQQGHNICTKEKALHVIEGPDGSNNSLNKQYEVVSIKKHVFRERTVVIKSKTQGEKEVHIDTLVGNKLCEENDALCRGDKVVIKEECVDPNLKHEYKVSEKYENDIVELSTGGYFFSKSFLTADDCIDSAK